MGKPLYTDKLTQPRGCTSHARTLIEVDATRPRVNDLNIQLLTGEYIKLEFIYEYETKYFVDCKTLGHPTGGCDGKKKPQ